MKTKHLFAVVSALFLAACGSGSEITDSTDTDAASGTDTGKPSTTDDSGTPSTDDTGTPSPTDSGTPSPTDSGTSSSTDSGIPPGEKGVINCGTTKCTLPQVCCVGFSGSASYKCASSCTGLSATAKCDGPEDCASGQACCAGFPSGNQCKASCGGTESALCHVDSDCKSGTTCKACNTPGGIMGFCVTGGKCPNTGL